MRDLIKQSKMRSKKRKSSTSEKHRRSSSKASRKSSKKSSKKKSSRRHTPSINGYFKIPASNERCRMKEPSLHDFIPSHQGSYIVQKLPNQSPFFTKITKRTKDSRNDQLVPSSSCNPQYPPVPLNVPMTQKAVNKSRNNVLNQIKTTVYTKTNSDNFFNIPCYAYGTNNKGKKSKGSKSKKSKDTAEYAAPIDEEIKKPQKIVYNPLQLLIANKLRTEMHNHNNNIVPANNSSGGSTQGSSTKDFISSAKKRKQQQE